jgi:hypothetical protein
VAAFVSQSVAAARYDRKSSMIIRSTKPYFFKNLRIGFVRDRDPRDGRRHVQSSGQIGTIKSKYWIPKSELTIFPARTDADPRGNASPPRRK